MWFWSGTVTSGEAHPLALSVPQCPCPPNHNGWRGHDINIIFPPLPKRAPAPPATTTNAPPPPQSGVPSQGQGHGAFQPDTDARWPDRTVHTAPPVVLGLQPESHADSWGTWERRRRRKRTRRMQGTNNHKKEQVELKLTGSTEQLNVSNSGQSSAWK